MTPEYKIYKKNNVWVAVGETSKLSSEDGTPYKAIQKLLKDERLLAKKLVSGDYWLKKDEQERDCYRSLKDYLEGVDLDGISAKYGFTKQYTKSAIIRIARRILRKDDKTFFLSNIKQIDENRSKLLSCLNNLDLKEIRHGQNVSLK